MATNASLLPRRPPVDEPDRETLVLPIGAPETDDLCSALGSDTARTIVAALADDPKTASEIADVASTSLQNARYHLERLRDAGLVRVIDTWYSEKGNEMDVYASPHDRLVLVAADGDDPPSDLDTATDRAPADDAGPSDDDSSDPTPRDPVTPVER
ncbi:MAG: ArsR/SmtB family transcription factor [Haloferacaceae archaeon]